MKGSAIPNELTFGKELTNMGDSLTISVVEAARCLGISRGLAYQGVKTGAIPSVKVGTRILVPKAALARMLEGKEARNDDKW